VPAIKQTIYIPEHIVRRIGELPDDVKLGTRINDMLDRYGSALAIARREVLVALTDQERQLIQIACHSWATRGEAAEILLQGITAELEDAALPGGVLQGRNVADLLAKLRKLQPMHHLALVEWLEQGHARSV
jgi:hypothetical protein